MDDCSSSVYLYTLYTVIVIGAFILTSWLMGAFDFIYLIDITPSLIVVIFHVLSSGGECSQVITLPAQSVWTVSCLNNGDIVTGSRSDSTAYKLARVHVNSLNMDTPVRSLDTPLRQTSIIG